MDRRQFLQIALALAAAQQAESAVAVTPKANAAAQPFDYAWLKGRARALAGIAYQPPSKALPEALDKLDYDHFQAIRPIPEHALWAELPLNFRVEFFHLGYIYKQAVKINEVIDDKQQPLAYNPAFFDLSKTGVDAKTLPEDLGFAGLRFHHKDAWKYNIAVFLGASYFRAVGASRQYGQSARGLAIDCGSSHGEEFPNFTEFWLERPKKGQDSITLYAMLDSASTTGAYRFVISQKKDLIMDVDAALYPRKAIERLGIAPLTSMYWYGENDRRTATDWRPEVHDTDGLAMWNGSGEWIWRPLVDSPVIRINSFVDKNPRGFGLMQRDRDFDHYQDDGVFYDKRPSLWVEPKAGWGEGAVQLVELPTADETMDNIVAYWVPKAPPAPGQELLFGYKLHWGEVPQARPTLAQVVATRTGMGGIIGQPRKYYSWRFSVDFQGAALATAALQDDRNPKVKAMISASRGKIEITSARPLHEIKGYRAMFDIVPDASNEPIDFRMYLALDGKPLTETWLYQWTPPPAADRKY